MRDKSAFLIAGTHSGCGKTTVSLALMAALCARGLRVQPFKVGPDFIDPGFHTQVTGSESRNLDGWMLSRDYNRSLFAGRLEAADVAVVEGVMGLFDGYDGVSESGSSAEMAKWLDLPVLLVVDSRSMARSAAAVVYGFSRFDSGLRIAGVIFNRIGGEGHLAYLKEAMAANVPEVPVLGGVPREDLANIPERHLGLVTADEIFLGPAWRGKMAQLVERSLDLDGILKATKHCPASGSANVVDSVPDMSLSRHSGAPGPAPAVSLSRVRNPGFPDPGVPRGDVDSTALSGASGPPGHSVRPAVGLAVARDAAFCFYYPDNLDLLRKAGAELHFFSPVAGEGVPEGVAGIYLGGGYPELFAEAISANRAFMRTVRGAASRGTPIYAECGGLMALGRFIETLDGKRYPMAGVMPFGTRMLPRRKALGYTEAALRRPCILGSEGLRIRGHEFHYSEIVQMEECAELDFAYDLRKRKYEASRREGYISGSVLASYVHLHWGSAPEAASAFVERCRRHASGLGDAGMGDDRPPSGDKKAGISHGA